MANEPTPQERLDQLGSRYRFRFAGHARVSRNPDLLDDMVEEIDAIAASLPEGDPLREQIDKDRALYLQEKDAILEARAVPGAIQAHRLRLWGDLTIGRYRRGFAGKSRHTRDVQLLEEVRVQLQALRAEMSEMDAAAPHLGLAQAIQNVSRNADLTRDEIQRIRSARTEGTQADQGTRLAQLANQQFELYQQGFAGQSRLSRHPPRLERIIKALEEIGGAMARLQRAGFVNEPNDRNLTIVTDRIRAYKAELTQMAETREGASMDDRVQALGAAANQTFVAYRDEYAGKPRSEADADRLNVLIEMLLPVAREMDAIDQDEGHELNESNLALVLDQLLLFHREWNAIREAASS